MIGRGGSAILGPDGAYLAGPLYDEEGILYAELDPARLFEERQRFDPAGHYHRPDVLQLTVRPQSANLRASAFCGQSESESEMSEAAPMTIARARRASART